MKSGFLNKKLAWGGALAGVAVVAALAGGGATGALDPVADTYEQAAPGVGGMQQASYEREMGAAPARSFDGADNMPVGGRGQSEAEQALEGLAQIRHQQCQMGNQLACQAIPSIPAIRSQLAQAGQACQSGDRKGCSSYNELARKIFASYSESAAVMRQGEQGMAQMDAWRSRMNQNAANSMANLQAQAARGQAAHEARQESYAAMNRSWQQGQDSQDRAQGRFVDRVYEGTTMSGGGVQSRIPDGSVGYTDGYGNIIAVPEGREAPDGWRQMAPTYAAPQ